MPGFDHLRFKAEMPHLSLEKDAQPSPPSGRLPEAFFPSSSSMLIQVLMELIVFPTLVIVSRFLMSFMAFKCFFSARQLPSIPLLDQRSGFPCLLCQILKRKPALGDKGIIFLPAHVLSKVLFDGLERGVS